MKCENEKEKQWKKKEIPNQTNQNEYVREKWEFEYFEHWVCMPEKKTDIESMCHATPNTMEQNMPVCIYKGYGMTYDGYEERGEEEEKKTYPANSK